MSVSLPARTYLLTLLVVGTLAFAAIGVGMLNSMRDLRATAQLEQEQAARTELLSAVETVVETAGRLTRKLGAWDEVHQQLHNPSYYVYWREQRLQDSQRFPPYVHAIELYAPDGQALVRMRDQSMPTEVDRREMLVVVERDRPYLLRFHPVETRGSGTGIVGYVGVKLDLLEAIGYLHRFVYVEASSIKARGGAAATLDPRAAVDLLSYTAVPIALSEEMTQIMTDALVRLGVLLAVLVLVFSGMVAWLFTRPLKRLNGRIDALRQGRVGVLAQDPGSGLPVRELERLRESLDGYQRELDDAREQLDQQNVDLWSMAHMDPLTGVYNRRAFDQDWRNLQDLARAQRLDVAFVLIDCDFFKAINDTYGHTTGDQVIQGIAQALQSALRKGDRLYRLGGDEFAALLLNADAEAAAAIGHRCHRAVLEHPFAQLGLREPVRVSVGFSHALATDEPELANLQRWADLAMYHAKHNRRERVVRYRPEMDRSAPSVNSNRVVNAVLESLESGTNIEMHYQPIVRLDTDAVEYYEALVRLRDDQGLIRPAEIQPVVRLRALEAELDGAVLRQVRDDLISGRLPPGAGVAVNLSGVTMGAPDLCERLAPLREFLERRKIVIEITETDLITQLQHVSESLNRLRGQGFTIALDDFGSGYSSIRYLAAMPVDVVKFDITMIRDLQRDDRARRIVEHTARLVLHAGYRLVAEGIEHETTLEIVRTLGFTHVQGFLFGCPQPLAREHDADSGAITCAGVDSGQ